MGHGDSWLPKPIFVNLYKDDVAQNDVHVEGDTKITQCARVYTKLISVTSWADASSAIKTINDYSPQWNN